LERLEGGQGTITSFLQRSSYARGAKIEDGDSPRGNPEKQAVLPNFAGPIDLTGSDSETSDIAFDEEKVVIDLTLD
jgi:hypothetical protein